MRFPIDVLYLGAENSIVKMAKLKPFRLSMGGKGAKKVLELPEDQIELLGLKVGERLSLTAGSSESLDLGLGP